MGWLRNIAWSSAVIVVAATAAPAQAPFGQVQGSLADFARIGADQTEALKVNYAIYQGIGFANTFMVVTPGGKKLLVEKLGGFLDDALKQADKEKDDDKD